MTYPSDKLSYGPKVNNQDKVVAEDVNILYTEVRAIEDQLGDSGVATSNVWGANTFVTSTNNWLASGGLRARLQNIENGLYAANLQRVTTLGGGTITSATGTVGLTVQGAANTEIFIAKNSSGTAVLKIGADGSIFASGTSPQFYTIDAGNAAGTL
ncbi:hypothetical protein UFOVP223_110 [uncultured Caudovirales phage]|uniref:Uncharacterized protein n=1 Tax=uncultured Caudovirales phage TaxID=2100421 RepID=A0A6J5L1X3_9CAUD|nr:hypothetical protein UFOVP110_54 [uncultured Caudovirales phage]CAB5219655.1 hypothetical protein UFOVP223_110 [uncultured Caudovirales phage]